MNRPIWIRIEEVMAKSKLLRRKENPDGIQLASGRMRPVRGRVRPVVARVHRAHLGLARLARPVRGLVRPVRDLVRPVNVSGPLSSQLHNLGYTTPFGLLE